MATSKARTQSAPMKFVAEQFTATIYDGKEGESRYIGKGEDTRAQKAKAATRLVTFLAARGPRDKFTRFLYEGVFMRLSYSAEMNIDGFYGTWFASAADRLNFIENFMDESPNAHPKLGIGDPRYTYSDVVQAVRAWITKEGLDAQMRREAEIERQDNNLAEAKRLWVELTPHQRALVVASA